MGYVRLTRDAGEVNAFVLDTFVFPLSCIISGGLGYGWRDTRALLGGDTARGDSPTTR